MKPDLIAPSPHYPRPLGHTTHRVAGPTPQFTRSVTHTGWQAGLDTRELPSSSRAWEAGALEYVPIS